MPEPVRLRVERLPTTLVVVRFGVTTLDDERLAQRVRADVRVRDTRDTMSLVEAVQLFDLKYDPNEVGGDMVVECWISYGPPARADDPSFDPRAGEWRGRRRPGGATPPRPGQTARRHPRVGAAERPAAAEAVA